MSIERYGVNLWRLWIPWPTFLWRDLWIGAYVSETYWEGANKCVKLYVCPLPTIVFCFVWTLIPYPKISDYKAG